MNAMKHAEELEFDLGEICLRGKIYGKENSNPLIALHGWLDNCGSFDFIVPHLLEQDYCVLTLDLAGHGKSDYRNTIGAYNIWQDIPELVLVADMLKWQEFSLLGHSRGAMVAMLFSACCPHRVKNLGLIDGVFPQSSQESAVVVQLKSSLSGMFTVRDKKRNYYSSFEDAVKARENGFTALCHADALVLAGRGVAEENGKFYWSSDPKLSIPSELKFTQNQIHEFISSLAVNPVLIMAEEGLVKEYPELRDWVKKYPDFQTHFLPGDHHLHMSRQGKEVADILIKSFLH